MSVSCQLDIVLTNKTKKRPGNARELMGTHGEQICNFFFALGEWLRDGEELASEAKRERDAFAALATTKGEVQPKQFSPPQVLCFRIIFSFSSAYH